MKIDFPPWITSCIVGECGGLIEMGFIGDTGAKYVKVACSLPPHHNDNHEVRDYEGRLIAWTGEEPVYSGPPGPPAYFIQEEEL